MNRNPHQQGRLVIQPIATSSSVYKRFDRRILHKRSNQIEDENNFEKYRQFDYNNGID